ncbi:rRNA pseudouridine synthase [Thermodesulfobacterium sp. TA1]|uniref:pseudouridine synthase n=1 Tax=Thermodesulfobacterium sp. TA1 TaxID=2234087 RepID=UPI0012324199|nr:pseudouridine synthase [Thermodesulfobacterium sp. TA1]QER42927.1 rRNA pseudouridine synthase [Thermodesulfobacterium sp. TA1]
MRLNKFLAACGVASRRKAEELIKQGKVFINGNMVTDLSYTVDPKKDEVVVEGKKVSLPEKVYYLFYKPKGFLTSLYDPHHRETIKVFLEKLPQRVFPVGRLDKHSEGLLLLTNDGDLANLLLHPKYAVERRYLVWVTPKLNEKKINQMLKEGVNIEGKVVKPVVFRLIKTEGKNYVYEVCVKEGIKREVRKMVAYLEGKVHRLLRVQFGPLVLENLKPGEIRPLSKAELQKLFRFVSQLKTSKTLAKASSGEDT